MANEQHLQIIKQGKDTWNAWRQEHFQIQPDLEGADLAGMDLSYFLLWKTQLRGANLAKALLCNTSLFGADLSYASLIKVDLDQANLEGAQLAHANCASVGFQKTQLRGTNFTEATLAQASFEGVNLTGAIFTKADLQHAQFDFANLSMTNLSGADLSDASFRKAQMDGTQLAEANLSRAYLHNTYLNKALLQHANFNNAILWETSFNNVDLSEVVGLETVRHMARSYIDLHTWLRSHGKIESSFLRGIGIPESFSHEMLEIVVPEKEITAFIAYHPADDPFARKLFDDLQKHGIRCWLASELFFEHGRAQPLDKILLVYSEHEWMGTIFFVKDAQEREQREATQLLFPLYIDQISQEKYQTLKKEEATQGHWTGDFVEWQREEAYQRTFQDLLKALREESTNKE